MARWDYSYLIDPVHKAQEEKMDKRIALITGANQGVGFQVARELANHGLTVLVGSRNLSRGEAAAKEIGSSAHAVQLDVTDRTSIAEAAHKIDAQFGRLDVLVQNAGIFSTRRENLGLSLVDYAPLALPSTVSLDEVKAIWETNVFGVLAVYQEMLPLLRKSESGSIVNVSSAMGSLNLNVDPDSPYHGMFGPGYSASKAALNAITLSMMVELENSPIKVRLASPAFTRTALTGYTGFETVEEGAREVVRVALLGPDEPAGTFTQWPNQTIPW
jgi:NAD(P)-dependent dehydrogenase (short-subunit alcohol dehydrogenase family)